ncbi:MAG: hypothetical protein IKB82_05430, partial [Clostridia bacterium]|nr:hypothetical protein [Clostridia bacterium]
SLIEVYKPSADLLISQQKVYIPRLEKDQIEYIMPKYIIGGQAYLVPQFTQLCIKLKYIHIFSTTIEVPLAVHNILVRRARGAG